MENTPTPTVPVAVPTAESIQAAGQYPVMPAFRQVIGDGYQAVKEIKGIKPGYKTTEFWLTIGFNIVNGLVLVLPADGIPAKVAGLIVGGVTIFGYSQSRGIAKSV